MVSRRGHREDRADREASGTAARGRGAGAHASERPRDGASARHEALLDQAELLVIALDRAGRITLVNRPACRALGRTEDELIGRDWFEHCVPEPDREGERAAFGELLDDRPNPPEQRAGRILAASGRTLSVLWHRTALRDGSGEVIGSLFSGLELDGRTSSSAHLLASLVDHTDDALLVLDPASGRLLAANERAGTMLSSSQEKLLTRAITDISESVPDARAWQLLVAEMRRNGSITRRSRYRRGDGSSLVVEVAHRITAAGGSEHVVSVVRDVSERLRAEEELRRAAIAFENTAEGVMVTEADGTIVSVNRAFAEITGYSKQELIGATPHILRSGRQSPEFYRDMFATLAEHGRWQGEMWNRRKNGEIFPGWLTVSAVRDEAGVITHYVEVCEDITAAKESEARLNHLAHHDPLTDLPNRLLFGARLGHALEIARRKRAQVGLLFLDLDRFKIVNDTRGHPAGDELLQQVARRLLVRVREEDTVARLGGDEFTVIMQDIDGPASAAVLARRILDAFTAPFSVGEEEVYVTASAGISLFPNDGADGTALLKNADTALYKAKEEGRNNFQFYTAALTAAVFERMEMETRLRRALERGELVLYYQPQVSLKDGRVVGAEALLRWRHPELGLVAPGRFISLAEETDLIRPIGNWVIQAACEQARAWQADGLPPLRIGVNVSAVQLVREELVDMVADAIERSDIPPESVEIEITENVITDYPERSLPVIEALRRLGVSLAIDDFGTGASSLTRLRRLPVHRLKIDRSFIQRLTEDPDDEAIARAIIVLGHSLQLSVIAEGVETEEQSSVLAWHGCDEVQGYLHSRPVPADVFAALIRGF